MHNAQPHLGASFAMISKHSSFVLCQIGINSHLQKAVLGDICSTGDGMFWAGSNPLGQETQLSEVTAIIR